MPLHPAPPTDLPSLVAGVAHTLQAVLDLGRACRLEDFDRPTDCPGWTVKDQLSHVVAVEAWLAGEPPPQVEVPDYPWIHGELARFMEAGVEVRRHTPGSVVVAELEWMVAQRVAWWANADLSADTIVPGPLNRTARSLAELRCRDVWCHEQDLRVALHRPGNLDCVPAQVFTQGVINALPQIVAVDAAVPVGQSVVFDITGPVVGRAGVRVIEGPKAPVSAEPATDWPGSGGAEPAEGLDRDGAPIGELLFTGSSDGPGVGGATTSITLSTEAFTRRAGGRWSVERTPHSVAGDPQIARRVMEALPVTP